MGSEPLVHTTLVHDVLSNSHSTDDLAERTMFDLIGNSGGDTVVTRW